MSKRSSQQVVGIHYAVGSKIGEGSFGIIFEGENILNGGSKNPVAIKFEPRRSDSPQLRDEFRAYRILNDVKGIPHAYYFSQEGIHNILIIDLLGPSLEDLFEWCSRKFSVKTTSMLAKQMIERVRSIHEHDLIYRDIKPDNFLISEFQRELPDGSVVRSCASSSNGDRNLIYVVDFGMAKQFRDPNTKQHIPYRERKSLSGTARYMSINTHFGREQSRRDDLESLGHVFFYFLRGSLPWQGLKAPNNKAKYEKIGLTKQRLKPSELLKPGIPKQFAEYLSYCRSLRFDQDPDYDYLISLMTQIMQENGYEDDGHYDWMDLNNGEGWNIKINKRVNLHGYGNPTPRNTKHSAQQLTPSLQQQQQQQQQHQSQSQQQQQQYAQQQNSRHDSRNYRSFSESTPNRSQNKIINSSGSKSRVRLSQNNGYMGPNVPLKQGLNIQTYDSMGKLHGSHNRRSGEIDDDNDSVEEGGFFSKLCCGIC